MPEKNNAQLQAEQEALYQLQQEEARKQAAQNAQTQPQAQVATPTTQGVQRIEGDFGGQEAFKVKGRPVNYGGKTVVTNQKVLDENLSRDATPGGWMLPPSVSEEQLNRAFKPIAGETPKVDQAKLDRLARMGRINEAGRVVGVAADVLGLGLGANVNKRPTDDLAAKLFDENDNVYKKLDDDKSKYRDKVAKWMNGRAAQPVYKTVTTTEKTNDIRETENVLLKTKPKDGAAGANEEMFELFSKDDLKTPKARLNKSQTIKAFEIMLDSGKLPSDLASSVRAAKFQMGEGNPNPDATKHLLSAGWEYVPELQQALGISTPVPAAKSVPFKDGQKVGDTTYNVTGTIADTPEQKAAAAMKNKTQEVMGKPANVLEIDMGGVKIGVDKVLYDKTVDEIMREQAVIDTENQFKASEAQERKNTGLGAHVSKVRDPEAFNRKVYENMAGVTIDPKDLDQKVRARIIGKYKTDQVNQYKNDDGTVKPAAKITATGKDARQF